MAKTVYSEKTGRVWHAINTKNCSVNNAFAVHNKMNKNLECGPMPNVMVALTNIGGALCSTTQSLADAHYLTAVQ